MVKDPFYSGIVEQDLGHIRDHFIEREKLKNATVLITGCSGFLGFYFLQYLCRHAKDLGLKSIIGLDNFKLGKPRWIESLNQQYRSEGLTLHRFDVAKDKLQELADVSEVDFVIHMASIASPTYYRQYPLETIDANVWGLRSLLDFYRDKELKGFLFFSTSEIYGDPLPDSIPTPEEYRGNVSSIGPRACYDESKRFGETLCYLYAQQYRMPIVIVRPFNNYGPGLKLEDKRVPADFAKAILENRDIVIHSDGTPTRTFCYVADAVVGYLKALSYGSFECFNIGIEEPEISIRQFAEINARIGREICGYRGSVVLIPSSDPSYLVNNPSRRCPDIRKARRLLNFSPTISVEEGVRRYLEHSKSVGNL